MLSPKATNTRPLLRIVVPPQRHTTIAGEVDVSEWFSDPALHPSWAVDPLMVTSRCENVWGEGAGYKPVRMWGRG